MVEKELQTEKLQSVEISVNAKGLRSFKIKVYAETIEEARATALREMSFMENINALSHEVEND